MEKSNVTLEELLTDKGKKKEKEKEEKIRQRGNQAVVIRGSVQ